MEKENEVGKRIGAAILKSACSLKADPNVQKCKVYSQEDIKIYEMYFLLCPRKQHEGK